MAKEIQNRSIVGDLLLEQKGYFGKSSKRRELEPSMFELLTWNASQTEQQTKEKMNQRILPVGYRNQSEKLCQQNKEETCQEAQLVAKQQEKKQRNSGKAGSYKKYSRGVKKQNEGQDCIQQRHSNNEKNIKAQSVSKKNKIKQSEENMMQQSALHVNQDKTIQEFRQTTRWLPNTSFTTYFGKPAFENYGRGNLTPSSGGVLYGDYMKSHNVQPHRGKNHPKHEQSYPTALNKAQKIGVIFPQPPKSRKNSISQINSPSKKIYPKLNQSYSLGIVQPNLYEVERFGGTGIKKSRNLRY